MVAFGKASGGGRRAAKREAAPLIAVMTTRSSSHNGILVDVSSTGARVRGDGLPCIGEDLIIGVEQVKAFGTVRWHSGNDCGIEFDRPLALEDVARLRREVANGVGLPPELRAAAEDWILGVAR